MVLLMGTENSSSLGRDVLSLGVLCLAHRNAMTRPMDRAPYSPPSPKVLQALHPSWVYPSYN